MRELEHKLYGSIKIKYRKSIKSMLIEICNAKTTSLKVKVQFKATRMSFHDTPEHSL